MSVPDTGLAAGIAGVGIDAVDVDRFRRLLARRSGLAARLFTESERADAAAGGDRAERLAARFAAKEATMKALGTGIGGFSFHDVEVVRAAGGGATRGAPSLLLRAGAAAVADARRVGRLHVSMTHTARTAMAVVVAEHGAPPATRPEAACSTS